MDGGHALQCFFFLVATVLQHTSISRKHASGCWPCVFTAHTVRILSYCCPPAVFELPFTAAESDFDGAAACEESVKIDGELLPWRRSPTRRHQASRQQGLPKYPKSEFHTVARTANLSQRGFCQPAVTSRLCVKSHYCTYLLCQPPL